MMFLAVTEEAVIPTTQPDGEMKGQTAKLVVSPRDVI